MSTNSKFFFWGGGLDETKNNRMNWLYFACMCFNLFIYVDHIMLLLHLYYSSYLIFIASPCLAEYYSNAVSG